MIRNTTIRRAVAATASVAAIGLVAATGHATESTSGSVDHQDSARHMTDSAADGAQLLGPELLGLSPETVDALVAADPELAASVSEGLRSGDPYTVDATLTHVTDLVADISTDGNAVDTSQDDIIVPPPQPVLPQPVLPQPPVMPQPVLPQPVLPQPVLPEPVIEWTDPELLQSESSGAERERVIAEITEDLDAG